MQVRNYLLVLSLAWTATAGAQQVPKVVTYPDMCDASAALAVNDDLFIAAGDENNILRVYRRDQPAQPQRIDLTGFLELAPGNPEVDIEGAARVGSLAFFIGSHGQNKNGKNRPNRHRVFAIRLSVQNGMIEAKPEGGVYTGLRSDLISSPALQKYNLAAAAKLAPELPGAFNIEGLAAAPDGRLMIGFRNPIPDGKSLIIPLENPLEIIQGHKARFGNAVELDLAGRGIRSLEYSEARGRYLIVAGPFSDEGTFALYSWSGNASDTPTLVADAAFPGLRPEAIFIFPGEASAVHFLSDDGGFKIEGVDCKDAAVAAQRFRAFSLNVP